MTKGRTVSNVFGKLQNEVCKMTDLEPGVSQAFLSIRSPGEKCICETGKMQQKSCLRTCLLHFKGL